MPGFRLAPSHARQRSGSNKNGSAKAEPFLFEANDVCRDDTTSGPYSLLAIRYSPTSHFSGNPIFANDSFSVCRPLIALIFCTREITRSVHVYIAISCAFE